MWGLLSKSNVYAERHINTSSGLSAMEHARYGGITMCVYGVCVYIYINV